MPAQRTFLYAISLAILATTFSAAENHCGCHLAPSAPYRALHPEDHSLHYRSILYPDDFGLHDLQRLLWPFSGHGDAGCNNAPQRRAHHHPRRAPGRMLHDRAVRHGDRRQQREQQHPQDWQAQQRHYQQQQQFNTRVQQEQHRLMEELRREEQQEQRRLMKKRRREEQQEQHRLMEERRREEQQEQRRLMEERRREEQQEQRRLMEERQREEQQEQHRLMEERRREEQQEQRRLMEERRREEQQEQHRLMEERRREASIRNAASIEQKAAEATQALQRQNHATHAAQQAADLAAQQASASSQAALEAEGEAQAQREVAMALEERAGKAWARAVAAREAIPDVPRAKDSQVALVHRGENGLHGGGEPQGDAVEEEEELDYDAIVREAIDSLPPRGRGERAEWSKKSGWGRKEPTGRKVVIRKAQPYSVAAARPTVGPGADPYDHE